MSTIDDLHGQEIDGFQERFIEFVLFLDIVQDGSRHECAINGRQFRMIAAIGHERREK